MKRNIPVSIRIAGLVTILVVLASGFSLTGFGIDKAHAATPKAISIPKAWGSVKGEIGGGKGGDRIVGLLILEDSGGVIRIVDLETGKVGATITRN